VEVMTEHKGIVVHLVHGTVFASTKSRRQAAIDGYWLTRQAEHFATCVADCFTSATVTKRIEFREFKWTGRNTFAAREEATRRLLTDLSRQSDPDEKHILVGHSHGGTVIGDALAQRTPDSFENVLGAITLATPFVTRTRKSHCGDAWLAIIFPFLAFAAGVAAGAVMLLSESRIIGSLLIAFGCVTLSAFLPWAGRKAATLAGIAFILMLPVWIMALDHWLPGSFVAFATFFGVVCFLGFAALNLLERPVLWLLTRRPFSWMALPDESDVDPGPDVPLLALRAPSDEATLTITAAQFWAWSENLLRQPVRRVQNWLVAHGWLYGIVVAALTVICGSLLVIPWGQWLTSPVVIAIFAPLSVLILSVVWSRLMTTFVLGLTVGPEVFDGIGFVSIYAEPLPRWKNQQRCRLEILHCDESETTRPSLKHSIQQLRMTHKRVAEWIEETVQSQAPQHASVVE
jgi:hypothetical protein